MSSAIPNVIIPFVSLAACSFWTLTRCIYTSLFNKQKGWNDFKSAV